jgi:1,5-anhydro-D-fructose reductase (1,5-anhydro-D-mannitol-forming)
MTMAPGKVRFGIIGFGRFAEKAIAPAIQLSTNSTLVALQKRDLSAAREKAVSLAVPLAFDTARELVSHPDVDAVFIVSANSEHCRETVAAAEAGKHVLVEKPMAMNAHEGERMMDACGRNGVRLMVAHMTRFSPLLLRMRDMVRGGEIGMVRYARADFLYDARLSTRVWLLDREIAGGGPVYDVGVHCLDALRFVLEDEVVSVRSQLEPLPTTKRTEEVAELTLKFSRGAIGSICCSFRSPVRRRALEIIGDDGILAAPDFTAGEMTIPLSLTRTGDDAGESPLVEEVVVPNLYVAEVSHFAECILSRREPLSPGLNGLQNQRVLDEALRVIP